MKRNHLIAAGAAVAALVVGAYFASPYVAVWSLRNAAIKADRDKLEKLVDFPSVRESLKAQANAQVLRSITEDPEMAENPFSGLAIAFVPAIVDRLVDGFVTADGIAAVLTDQKPQPVSDGPPPPKKEPAKVTMAYRNLDTFTVAPQVDDPAIFVMKREGLFTWQVSRIDMPANIFKAPPSE